MNYLGLTVFAGNTPGLILDFDPSTKEYTVEFTDGRVVKTAKVYWDKTIPSEPDIAFYRQSTAGNGEQLVYDAEIGWDIVSAIDIVDQPSDLGDWVDDYKSDDGVEQEHSSIEDKLDKVLETLDVLVEKDSEVHDKLDEAEGTGSAVQPHDAGAENDSEWDRELKPNPMAMDNEFGSGSYKERNDGALPGGRDMTAKTAKDCGCWEGYKRVPGTKPCAPGSCEKCDSARKKESAKKNTEEAVKKVNTVPPAGVRAAAKRGLKYYEEGKAGDGFEAATADRARKIAAGEALTEEHINRMHSFFERHAGGRSKKAKPGEVTAWDVAWLCWGGDAGRSWAAKVDAQLHKARHPNSKGKHSADETRMYWETGGPHEISEGADFDDEHMRSDVGPVSDVRHAEGEAQKNQHGDQEGNADMRGVGDQDREPSLDDRVVTLDGVDIDELNPDDYDAILGDMELDENDTRFAHVRKEAQWTDKFYAKNDTCPDCGDPLVNNNCYSCGESKKKKIKDSRKIAKKISKELSPFAEQLGVVFGNALAGNVKESVTQPSEGIFAIEIHGVDSHPENGGTGNYNDTHGDSPDLLKDVNHGGGGWIDATPELLSLGMPKVIELSESDESGEGDKVVKMLEKIFDKLLGNKFTDSKEKTKKEKNSSLKVQAASRCNICGNVFSSNQCKAPGVTDGKSLPGCPAVNSAPVDDVGMAQSPTGTQGGHSVQNAPTMQMGVSSVGTSWSTGGRPNFSFSGAVLDSDGNPLEVGQTYRAYVGNEDAPDIVKVESLDPEKISISKIGLESSNAPAATSDLSYAEIESQDMKFDKENVVNPVEVDGVLPSPTDGTPESNDDAGPGHNDIPGQRDLSRAHESSIKEAGRDYRPNEQKAFINEGGSARNLDKLILDGTHYVDGETTASDNFDDDFLFGV